ncbi:hypothetical protein [Actinoallomurus sp. NPDC052274]|uniref:hypothetical protein n=1 Tax=Actinoallomurus sp. NPDC052274 TaxID=3155420 RepID=UPI0034293AEA
MWFDLWGYSGLHTVRRLAVHLAEHAGVLPVKRGSTTCGRPPAPDVAHPANQHESSCDTDEAPPHPIRRLIALSIGEVRRLFNLIDNDDHMVDQGLYWSIVRRAHQAEARRHHVKRRLRLQVIQI